jgi:hypothetical protein
VPQVARRPILRLQARHKLESTTQVTADVRWIAIEPETMPDGTSDAYLWKARRPAIPKASPRTLAVAAWSALGHPSLHVSASRHAFWSIPRTSRLAIVNALHDQRGMRAG